MKIDLNWVRSKFPELEDLALLGSGGQKLVFTARHKEDGEIVLKLIRPSEDIESIRREVLAVQEVASGRVPPILAVGQVSSSLGDCFWIREKRIQGDTLRHIITREGKLPASEVLCLAHHVLEALSDSERAHIVHRDVKPENIMRDMLPQYWLLDFGIARHLSLDSQTATISPFGKFTPGYAPREQFRNIKSDIDSRSDLFALGITLFESLSGVNPFLSGTSNVLEVLSRVESSSLPRINTSGIEELSDFIEALTQRRRDHRPASAAEALSWLRDIIKRTSPKP